MRTLVDLIKRAAHPLSDAAADYDPLLDLIGGASFVLLGAQTHGTHEFYRERAQITKRLITERGFSAVAIEADWPDTYGVNRFVRGEGEDADSVEALGAFTAFPAWMWRNADVVDFVGWLKAYNDALLHPTNKVGFYGLDLYGLHKSVEAVIRYLDHVDPVAAAEARQRYDCFDHAGEKIRRYGFAVRLGLAKSCEDGAVRQLVELRRRHGEWLQRDGPAAEEEIFSAEQNALLIENAERYYRAMFGEQTTAWNQRDGHMMETLLGVRAHLQQRRRRCARVVVWSHNAHVGDARATEFGLRENRISLGQLVRRRCGEDAVLVGFTTDSGTVTAATDWWDSPPRAVPLQPAVQGSYEALFHQVGHSRFLLNLRDANKAVPALSVPRLERAVGIVHRADAERGSEYFKADLPRQFDAVIHLDVTRAVEPIERTSVWEKAEVPETFPSGV